MDRNLNMIYESMYVNDNYPSVDDAKLNETKRIIAGHIQGLQNYFDSLLCELEKNPDMVPDNLNNFKEFMVKNTHWAYNFPKKEDNLSCD